LSEYFPDSVDISTSTLPAINTSNNIANSTKPPRGINFKVIFHPGLHVDYSGKYGNRKVYRLNGQVGPH
ncbi:5859_t:CDS:2, partial [Ambispora leptoticha]